MELKLQITPKLFKGFIHRSYRIYHLSIPTSLTYLKNIITKESERFFQFRNLFFCKLKEK